jgi:hypothetical protein
MAVVNEHHLASVVGSPPVAESALEAAVAFHLVVLVDRFHGYRL